MGNLDFYATLGDHKILLDSLFQQGDLRIFESYSAFDSDLREFSGPTEILALLAEAKHPRHSVLLQLWAPAVSSKVDIRRFAVSFEGHNFRHQIVGWGLIQLYLAKETPTEIYASHFGHFSEKGAARHVSPSSINSGTEADWDWALLGQISRKIQYRIRTKLSSTKFGSRPVLHNAAQLAHQGWCLPLN